MVQLLGYVVLLDIGGKAYTSPGLAEYLDKLTLATGAVTFVVGGSRGVSEEVREAAADRISFSAMTFPHQLFRVMLLEQLYRACTIRAGTGYHK